MIYVKHFAAYQATVAYMRSVAALSTGALRRKARASTLYAASAPH